MTKSINRYIEKINVKIDEILDESPKVLKPVMTHLKFGKGKNIRSKLMISTVLDLENEVTEKILNLCVATELMHLSTLIHDDVIDNAPLRRGIQSVQSKFGNKLAVITGDYLYTKCFTIVSENGDKALEEFAKTIELICLGEVYQLQNNMNFKITDKEYLKIISGKTAVMFSLAMYSVVVENKETAEILGKAGYYFGMVFQLVDDYLDYDSNYEQTKKEKFKDLKNGVITYPLIKTFEKNKELIILLENDFSEKNIEYVISEVLKSGGLSETKQLIDKYYNLGKDKLEKIINLEYNNTLEVIDLIYTRSYK